MNAPSSIRPVHGKVDGQGRLIEADPPLLRLQERAGGVQGGALAIPQLASLVRLTRRLKIVLSRRVVAAHGDQDVDLWVQVTPLSDGVALAITGWQESAAAVPSPSLEAVRWRDFSRASADWIIETDAMLRVTQPPANLPGSIGQPIEALFTLSCDEQGLTRIAEAARRAERCEDDAATFLIGTKSVPVRIAGVPLFDGIGALAGYQLLISRRDPLTAPRYPDPPPLDEAFGTQLGRAMREPLDRIIANADAIQDRGDGPVRRDYADYAEDIAGAGRHLLALVDDLVDLQTIERPDFQPEAEPVDLVDTALRAAGLLGVRAADHQVRLDPPAAGQLVMARGDFRRILQILINLLSNAIRHSPAGGAVLIRCEREGDIAAVVVADTGEGIAPEHQERIFERFERLGLRDGTGSGLGLYISRRLARAMGGDLGVDSAPGKGARFVFTLPVGN
jgi:signal transduction histidine kinase